MMMAALLPLFEKAHLSELQARREWLSNELKKLPPHSRKRAGIEYLLANVTIEQFSVSRDLMDSAGGRS
jgi:hypothetical protein